MANCQAGMTGTGLGELEEPRGLDVSTALGFVYVVDQGNHRVQRWTGLNPLSAISSAPRDRETGSSPPRTAWRRTRELFSSPTPPCFESSA